MTEQFHNLLPYQIIEPVCSYLQNVTDAVAAETVGIGPNTAVIGVVPLMSLRGTGATREPDEFS
ncbi:hypothetical protein [Cupriavidus basilensis]|uniref:hypothetical protein n=1 Tax=Cupriavidus basilensis TaxID=68895 RepID=UPI0023E868E0|nr:hypothetical protein [Cupriavidus basilensis]MDF3884526.1 hypothetical protein [Cupriavidus basilensis]